MQFVYLNFSCCYYFLDIYVSNFTKLTLISSVIDAKLKINTFVGKEGHLLCNFFFKLLH